MHAVERIEVLRYRSKKENRCTKKNNDRVIPDEKLPGHNMFKWFNQYGLHPLEGATLLEEKFWRKFTQHSRMKSHPQSLSVSLFCLSMISYNDYNIFIEKLFEKLNWYFELYR